MNPFPPIVLPLVEYLALLELLADPPHPSDALVLSMSEYLGDLGD